MFVTFDIMRMRTQFAYEALAESAVDEVALENPVHMETNIYRLDTRGWDTGRRSTSSGGKEPQAFERFIWGQCSQANFQWFRSELMLAKAFNKTPYNATLRNHARQPNLGGG